eukprot:TRINITY_DN39919_c0_g1_i1.p1 TRINITY_DN39919_c0_g1~~TRINITY_DN39919_c0_g1_i1.p1  ORF type:complete len:455 (+),score=137.72 TRINITY_DN39919_c0_g1_i1:16-1380(+)
MRQGTRLLGPAMRGRGVGGRGGKGGSGSGMGDGGKGGDGGGGVGYCGKGAGKAARSGKGGGKGSSGARFRDKADLFTFSRGTEIRGGMGVYRVLSHCGDGSFGRVLLAEESGAAGQGRRWALKLMAPKQTYNQYTCDAWKEAEILDRLRDAEGFAASGCMRIREHFACPEAGTGREFVCLVLEPYQCTLHDFVQRNESRGFDVSVIQTFARQILSQVEHMHSVGFIHTDIKHKNIMMQSGDHYVLPSASGPSQAQRGGSYLHPASPVVSVIDFGSGVFPGDHKTHPIHTKQFRAPEVTLGRAGQWGKPSDMWTVGCVLVWLYTGRLLFNTHETPEQLAMLEAAVGPLPAEMVREAEPRMGRLFDCVVSDAEAMRRGGRLLRPATVRGPDSFPLSQHFQRGPAHKALADLCAGLLKPMPPQRLTAEQALAHCFLSMELQPEVKVPPAAAVMPWRM